MRAVLAAALLVLTLSTASAQEAGEEPAASASPTERIEALTEALEEGEPVIRAPAGEATASGEGGEMPPDTRFLPDLVDPDILDEAGQDSLRGALKAYYDYRIEGFQHRTRVFEWQLLSSRLIFGLVILIVVAGLWFSWLQFRAGLRENAGSERTSTTLEASATGIKLSSPILGVIILTLSLVFFYLYLVHVYPIQEVL